MTNNYDQRTYDALSASNWHGKAGLDAKSAITGSGTGMLNQDQASLLAMRAGKENASAVMRAADEKMSADEVIMQGRMAMEQFYKELMIQQESISAVELQAVYRASSEEYAQYEAPQLANQNNGADGPLMATVGVTIAARALNGLKNRFDAFADRHNISPRTRKVAYTLMAASFLLACSAAPFIPSVIETMQPPLETLVAPVGTLVNEDAEPVGAQGITPSVTPRVTKEATNTPKATASATEAAVSNLVEFIKKDENGGWVIEGAKIVPNSLVSFSADNEPGTNTSGKKLKFGPEGSGQVYLNCYGEITLPTGEKVLTDFLWWQKDKPGTPGSWVGQQYWPGMGVFPDASEPWAVACKTAVERWLSEGKFTEAVNLQFNATDNSLGQVKILAPALAKLAPPPEFWKTGDIKLLPKVNGKPFLLSTNFSFTK